MARRSNRARQAARSVRAWPMAVANARQRGIIHRDLKPANVLLTANGVPEGQRLRAGQAARGRRRARPSRARSWARPATWLPEQAQGKLRGNVGPCSDVHYAMGGILYELTDRASAVPGPASVLDTLEQVRTQGADPAIAVPAQGAAQSGNDLFEMLAKRSRQALRHGSRTGRGSAPVPGRRADSGAARQPG